MTEAVAVPVTTLWSDPSAVRPIDAPAVTAEPDLEEWLDRLDREARLGLVGRVESQALLGDPVEILGERAGWYEVILLGQATSKDPRGYPGWLPVEHVRRTPKASGAPVVVTGRHVPAYGSPSGRAPRWHLSYGTRLTTGETALGRRRLLGPDGDVWVADTATEPHQYGTSAEHTVTGQRLVADARRFVGLPYLWGGRCDLGYDCSGLVGAVHGRYGVSLPRDAHDQAGVGEPVDPAAPQAGDLLFFVGTERPERITHVGMAVSAEAFIHAPQTGKHVMVSAVDEPAYAARLVAARRLVLS